MKGKWEHTAVLICNFKKVRWVLAGKLWDRFFRFLKGGLGVEKEKVQKTREQSGENCQRVHVLHLFSSLKETHIIEFICCSITGVLVFPWCWIDR